MSEREEAIEKIAQEEVYPARIKRDFVEWPSRSIRYVHTQIAEKIYDERQAEAKKRAKKKPEPVEPEVEPESEVTESE